MSNTDENLLAILGPTNTGKTFTAFEKLLSYSSGIFGFPLRSPYSASKWAVVGMTKTLAMELGKFKIRVNAISPGPMKTLAGAAIGGARQVFRTTEKNAPLRKNADLESVGNAALYLLSDNSSSTTGEILYVDGGYHIMGLPQIDNI